MAAGPVTATSSMAVPSARRNRALLPTVSVAREPARAWAAAGAEGRARRGKEAEVEDEKEAERRRKEEVNRKIASRKALSVILRREATKAVLDKRKPGKGTRRLLPGTVLEALHDRIAALRWDSALKVQLPLTPQTTSSVTVALYLLIRTKRRVILLQSLPRRCSS